MGKDILEESSGQSLGRVQDLIFDTDKGALKAILVSGNQFLLFSNISSWKIRIYVKSSLLFHTLEELKEVQKILEQEVSILGNRIKNEDGAFLGYCEDIIFNEKTGTIMQLVNRAYLFNIIPLKTTLISSSDILEITHAHILVRSRKIKDAVPEA